MLECSPLLLLIASALSTARLTIRPGSVRSFVFLLFLTPGAVEAQQVIRGRLIDETAGAAVAGAFVRVHSGSPSAVEGTISDSEGLFSVRTGTPEAVSLLIERIGFASHRVTLLPLRDSIYTIVLSGSAVALDPILVTAETACNGTMSMATARILEEVSKALRVAVWSADVGEVRYSAMQYAREYANAGFVFRQDSQAVTLTREGSPYFGSPVDSLLDFGFVRMDTADSAVSWFGPDMGTILDDRFQQEYCFMEASEERKGLHGVRFRPVSVPRTSGVDGVLWADAATGELRELQFTYVFSPFRQQMDGQGSLEFTRLATGHWIVSRWHLRVPRFVEIVEKDRILLHPFGEHEIDRQVLEARSADGTLLWQRVRR